MKDKLLINKINKTIEDYFPRKANDNFYKLFQIDKNYPAVVLEKGLLLPFWNFMDRGGKRWRILLFYFIYNSLSAKSANKYLPFAIISEIIHNASLIVDDIEDRSDIRRRQPCLHKIYGVDIAINLGNFLYFIPYSILETNKKMISESQYSGIRKLIDQEMINIHLGQNFDIVGHRGMIKTTDYSEKNYLIMVSNKTGCMIRLALQIAGVLAKVDRITLDKLSQLGTTIATLFQVTDDLLNLVGEERKYGKEIGGDISEGKITLMIIDCLKKASAKDSELLVKILHKHTKNQKYIIEAIKIIKKYDSIKYAEQYCDRLVSESIKIIKSIKFKKEPDELIGLIDQLTRREK